MVVLVDRVCRRGSSRVVRSTVRHWVRSLAVLVVRRAVLVGLRRVVSSSRVLVVLVVSLVRVVRRCSSSREIGRAHV